MPKKKPKITSLVFVMTGIATLVSVGFIILQLRHTLFLAGPRTSASMASEPATRYYFNDNADAADPYLTKAPSLKDMLRGPIISGDDPEMGNQNASTTIVVFSDYTCVYCEDQEKIILDWLKEEPDRFRYVRKDYPAGKIDSASWQMALAARCAGEQERYWEYHDALIGRIEDADSDLSGIAGRLGLDVKRFNDCLASAKFGQNIDDNIEEANALDIYGVPYIYVNDQGWFGQATRDDLEQLVPPEPAGQN